MSSVVHAETFAWLEHRLDQWAQWKRGGISSALGYGSLLGRYTKQDVRGGPSIEYDNPAFDRMMLELDQAVIDLPAELRKVVKMTHDETLPVTVMAAHLEVSVSTLYNWRRRAYQLLALRVKE